MTSTDLNLGQLLPHIVTPPPGPRSRSMTAALVRAEAPAISTTANGDQPIFWERAAGANVVDVDGNRYIDATSAFGVASMGHGHPVVVAAVQTQAGKLLHGMGDFLPFAPRAAVAERLAARAPMQPAKVLFGLSGADAVELAVKAATVFTGRPGVLAFDAAFHGQSYGALALTARETFRTPFIAQLGRHVLRAPYPYPFRFEGSSEACAEASLAAVEELLDGPPPPAGAIGAVLVEPMAGREGEIVPPPAFLPGLRRLCDERDLLLIADEIYTGMGRTGRLFAVEHTGVVPDLLCAGKALGGGMPVSCVLGRADVLDAWHPTSPEAPHSSTFLAHPVSLAAVAAVLDVFEQEDMVGRAARLGWVLGDGLALLAAKHRAIGDVRGTGAMWGLELVRDGGERAPATELLGAVVGSMLGEGIIALPAGMHGNVLSLSPPFVITDEQVEAVVNAIDRALSAARQ